MMLRLCIADDHVVFRMGLANLISAQVDLEFAGEASSGSEAVSLYRLIQPDVFILDMRMPKGGGLQAIEAIIAEFPDARLLVLSSYASEEEVYRAIHAGAKGYILKESTSEELLSAIRAVGLGGHWVPQAIASQLVSHDPKRELTQREKEVLALMIKGLSNREIAGVLRIGESTVNTHTAKISSKLDVSNRTEAVSAALQRGLISVD